MHPSNGEAWKHFNSVHPHFLVESRNVRLGLCTDEFDLNKEFESGRANKNQYNSEVEQ